MRFGAHVSIADHIYLAIDRAVAVGCEAIQIFPGNPRGWKTGPLPADAVKEFKKRRREASVGPVAIHLPYLVNLSSARERIVEASIGSLKDALSKALAIEAEFLVMHTGSHSDTGGEDGVKQVAAGLRTLLEEEFGPVKLLLENTAGAGHTLGATPTEIAEIIAAVDNDPRLGLCFDTCHAFAAGYDLRKPAGLNVYLDELDASMGIDRMKLVHANDSKGELGSHLDRHEHIGEGKIGLAGFRHVINHPAFAKLAFIIETPRKGPEDEERNLATLRNLREPNARLGSS